MEAIGVVLAVVALVAMGAGAWGLWRGGVGWAHLATRKTSGAALGAGFAAFILAGALLPTPARAPAAPTANSAIRPSDQSSARPGPTSTTLSTEADEEDASTSAPIGPVSVPATPLGAPAGSCRPGNPLANVYCPERLRVITACTTVSGTIAVIRSEPDGDVHFNLELDAPYARLVNEQNRSQEHGQLVIEIVPADGPGCTPGLAPRAAVGTYDYGTCSGAALSTPVPSSHVSVTGPYVLDTAHGWMEIHPAWTIAVLSGQPAVTTAAPASTRAPAPIGRRSAAVLAGRRSWHDCGARAHAYVHGHHLERDAHRQLDGDGPHQLGAAERACIGDGALQDHQHHQRHDDGRLRFGLDRLSDQPSHGRQPGRR